MKISCYLIGEDSLLIQCGNLLLSKNHDIELVISPVKTIQDWANKNNIFCLSSMDSLTTFNLTKTDYIFSIVNSHILSHEVLKFARKMVINYHDSLLPKYAGVNSTTWAIINGESSHGVTWHMVNDKIDEGEILEQHSFPIQKEDSAFTLNLLCYEQAIKSFERLLTNIEKNNISCTKQNLQEKLYFSVGHVLPNFGFIDWEKFTAEFVIRLSRSLTFGHYNNHVGTLKICINDSYIIVTNVDYSYIKCSEEHKPGTVLSTQGGALHIATIKQAIKINHFVSTRGTSLPIAEIIKIYNISVGFQFSSLKTQHSKKLKALYSKALKNEYFWLRQIQNTTEHNTFSYQTIKKDEKIVQLTPSICLRAQLKLQDRSTQKNSILAAILVYLFRLNNYGKISVSILYRDYSVISNQLGGLLACLLPMVIDWPKNIVLSKVVHEIAKQIKLFDKHQTHLTDIIARHPSLESNCPEPAIIIDIMEDNSNINHIAKSQAILYFKLNLTSQKVHIYHRIEAKHQNGELNNVLHNIKEHIVNILDVIITKPHLPISGFCFLTPLERYKLLTDWGKGKKTPISNYSIASLFDKQAKKYPNNLAISMASKTVSYYDLWAMSEKIAIALNLLNLKKQTLIGIYLQRSIEMIAVIIGILKVDCVYVPLDIKYPILKNEAILDEAKLAHIITSNDLIKNMQLCANKAQKMMLYSIEKILSTKNKSVDMRSRNESRKNNLAYIMFTSGTTGAPKGVMVTQRNIINYCQWFAKTTRFDNAAIIDFSSSIAFDLSIPCTIAPLLVGGCIAICDDMIKTNPQAYLNYLIKNKVTHVELTPGYVEMLLNYPELIKKLLDLKVMLLGADVVLSNDVAKWLALSPFHQIVNEYGPTETTVSATSYFINKDAILNGAAIPIGKPAFNTSCYILDKKGNLLPSGVRGELCIGGAQVTNGYLDKDELTKEKFINVSFCSNKETIYKTGDLACWLPDGNIQFFGRNDCQIKIQGYRIELAEIEAALLKIPAIHQAIVIVKYGHFREKYLRAYLVLHSQQTISNVEIKKTLSLYLANYMIPKEFYIMQSIPLKENEKIDFAAFEKQKHTLLVTEHRAVEGLTKSEETILHVWRNVFNDDSITIHEDFFELGGDSMLALQIIANLSKHYNHIPLHYLFEYPTVSLLSNKLAEFTSQKVKTHLPTSNKHSAALVKLSSGNSLPIFLVHPVGGSVFWYKKLSTYLGAVNK